MEVLRVTDRNCAPRPTAALRDGACRETAHRLSRSGRSRWRIVA
jgi:hypothetical protein